jgi:hypothetical protein
MLKGMRDELFKLASEEGGLKLAANRMMRELRSGEVTPEDVADAYALAADRPGLERALGSPNLQPEDFRFAKRRLDEARFEGRRPNVGLPMAVALGRSESLEDRIVDALSARPLHDRKDIEYLRRDAEEILKNQPHHSPDYTRKILGDLLSKREEDLPTEWQPYTTARRMKRGLYLPNDPLRHKVFLKGRPEWMKNYVLERILPDARRIEFMDRRRRRLAEALNQAVTPTTQNLLPAASSPLPNLNEESISRILHPVTPPPDLPAIQAMGDVGAESPLPPPAIAVERPAVQAAESAVTERPVIQAMENAATEPPTIKAIQRVGQVADTVGKKPMNPWLKRGLIGAGLVTAGLGAYGLYRALSKKEQQDEEEGGLKLAANRMMRELRSGEVTPEDVADAYALANKRSWLEESSVQPNSQPSALAYYMQSPEGRREAKNIKDGIVAALSAKPYTPEALKELQRRAKEEYDNLAFRLYTPGQILNHSLHKWEKDLPEGMRPWAATNRMRYVLFQSPDPLDRKMYLQEVHPTKVKDYILERILHPASRATFMNRRNRRLAEALNRAVDHPPNLLPAASSPLPNLNEESISRILHPVASPPELSSIPAMGDVGVSPPVPPSINVGLPGARAAESVATERHPNYEMRPEPPTSKRFNVWGK